MTGVYQCKEYDEIAQCTYLIDYILMVEYAVSIFWHITMMGVGTTDWQIGNGGLLI